MNERFGPTPHCILSIGVKGQKHRSSVLSGDRRASGQREIAVVAASEHRARTEQSCDPLRESERHVFLECTGGSAHPKWSRRSDRVTTAVSRVDDGDLVCLGHSAGALAIHVLAPSKPCAVAASNGY